MFTHCVSITLLLGLCQASVKEADASGRYDPLPVRVPVDRIQAWHDAEEGTPFHGSRHVLDYVW